VNLFSPFLKIMGLDKKLGFLWNDSHCLRPGLWRLPLLWKRQKTASLSKEDLEMLHLSIGINHSMWKIRRCSCHLGLSAFWLYVPPPHHGHCDGPFSCASGSGSQKRPGIKDRFQNVFFH